MTPFSRRAFLGGTALAALYPSALLSGCARTLPPAYWASAATDSDGGMSVAWSAPELHQATRVETGFRGHAVAANPVRPWEVALFARRPGTVGAVVDLLERRVLTTFDAPEGRAFQGHGFFTDDGAHLITCEADVGTAAGWLGVRAAEGYELVAEVETFGVGPHEVRSLGDDVVVVANGGLLTRPETGREVLNLESMDSTLAYVSLATGELLDSARVDVPKGSIRHLDLADDDTVVFGLQVQREAVGHDTVFPLGGQHRAGEAPVLFQDGLDAVSAMQDYVGSVAVEPTQGVAGMTSPRGDVACFWRLADGAYVGAHRLIDCSGIAAHDGRFLLTSSVGELRTLDASDLTEVPGSRQRHDGVRWDNHLTAVTVENDS